MFKKVPKLLIPITAIAVGVGITAKSIGPALIVAGIVTLLFAPWIFGDMGDIFNAGW